MGRFTLELHVEVDREDDGRWFAVAVEIPGVMAYAKTEEQALARAKILSLQVVTDRLERSEGPMTGLAIADHPAAEYMAAFSGLGFTPVSLAC
jgi:predicted RNase H-like HicB family nuclease